MCQLKENIYDQPKTHWMRGNLSVMTLTKKQVINIAEEVDTKDLLSDGSSSVLDRVLEDSYDSCDYIKPFRIEYCQKI